MSEMYLDGMELGMFQDESGKWHARRDVPNHDGAQLKIPHNVVERCRSYIAKMPRAESGNSGHDACWYVAQAIFRGFSLSHEQGWPLLLEYNQTCVPPWSDKELEHKIKDVMEKSRLPMGFVLLKSQTAQTPGYSFSSPSQPIRRTEEPAKVDFKKLHGVLEFPIEVFPPALQRFAQEIAQSIGCPVDYPGTTMIAVAAAAMGNTRQIRIKRGWNEGPRFYLAITADPGAAKSPVIKTLCKPIYKRQEWLHASFQQEKDEFERAEQTYEAQCKSAKRNGSLMPNKPRKPKYPHIFTTNSTCEKLAVMLSENPRGLVMIQDELTSWVMGMNQYKAGGKGSDRQFFLSAWSGEATKTDRKGDEQPIFTPRPFLNIIGGIQPDMLRALMNDEGQEDGFVHRILFSFPKPIFGAPWTDTEPSLEGENYWDSTISRLLELRQMETQAGEIRPFSLIMTQGARRLWQRWYDEMSKEMSRDGFPVSLLGPWSKMRAYCARFALLFQFIWNGVDHPDYENWETQLQDVQGDERIGTGAMYCGVLLAEYFKSHFRKVMDTMGMTQSDKRLDKAMDLAHKKPGMEISTRDMVRARLCKKTSEAAALMEEMEARGWGQVKVQEGEGKAKRTTFRAYSNEEIAKDME